MGFWENGALFGFMIYLLREVFRSTPTAAMLSGNVAASHATPPQANERGREPWERTACDALFFDFCRAIAKTGENGRGNSASASRGSRFGALRRGLTNFAELRRCRLYQTLHYDQL